MLGFSVRISVYRHFQQYFSYIVVVSFIGGGSIIPFVITSDYTISVYCSMELNLYYTIWHKPLKEVIYEKKFFFNWKIGLKFWFVDVFFFFLGPNILENFGTSKESHTNFDINKLNQFIEFSLPRERILLNHLLTRCPVIL